MTRLYLRNKLDTTSNLPTAEQASLTSVQDCMPQTDNLGMFTNKGIMPANANIASFSYTVAVKEVYIGRWVYPLTTVTSLSANTWTLLHSSGTGNNIHKFALDANKKIYINLYVWRPGTGKIATVFEGDSNATTASIPHASAIYRNTFSGSSVSSIQNTDFLVLELWSHTSSSTGGNQNAMFYYNGTDDTSADGTSSTNAAAYLETPQTLPTLEFNPTKLYFHETLSDVSGTLPSSEQNTAISTIEANVDAQTVNRTMNDTIGTSQTSKQLSVPTVSSTRNYYFTRFVSPPLGAQTISAGDWGLSFAVEESATSVNFPVSGTNLTIPITCYVWRPSTGEKVADIKNGSSSNTFSEPSSANSEQSEFGTFAGSEVTLQAGDVIVIEFLFSFNHGTTSGRTATLYYDGTTEEFTTRTVVSSIASCLIVPATLDFTSLRNLERTISDSIGISDISPTKLRNKVREIGSVYDSDNFESGTYSFTEGGTSPNGKWTNQYLGGTGSASGVRLSASVGNNVMWQKPQVSTAQFETHATFTLFNTTYSDFDLTVDLRTISQLRQNFTPNSWETAWILFRYTDNWHHYYLVLKTGGIELGRKDYATQIEQQIFLVTNATPFTVVGRWENVRIRAVKNRFTVWVNGVFAFDFTDDGSVGYDSNTGGLPAFPSAAMFSGKIGLYNEDAEVEFNNFIVAETHVITISEAISRLRNLNQTMTDTVGPIANSNNRYRGKNSGFTDNVGPIADTNSRLRGLIQLFTDNIGPIADSMPRLTNRLRTITENIGTISSNHTRLRGLLKVFTDNVGPIASVHDRFRHFNKFFTDNIGPIAETIAKNTQMVRTFTENISITSDHFRITDRFKGFTENITITDNHERLRGFVKLFTDNIGPIASNHTRLRGFSKTITENIGPISDTASRFKVLLIRTITENITIASNHSRLRDLLKDFTENIVIEDLHVRLRNKLRDFTENITITSVHNRYRGLLQSFTENIGPITSVHLRLVDRIRTFTDNITIASEHSRIKTILPRLITEDIGINSTVIYSIVRSFYIKLLRIKTNKNNII